MPFPCIWYSLIYIFIRLAFAIASSPVISGVEGLFNALPTGTTELINILNTTSLSQIAESPNTTNLSQLASPPNTTTLNLTNTPTCYRPSSPFSPDPAISECIAAANYMTSLSDAYVPKTWSATAPYGSRWNMASCEIYLDSPFIDPTDTFALAAVAEEAIRIAMFCATRADYRRTTGGFMTVGPGDRWEVKVKPRQIPRGAEGVVR